MSESLFQISCPSCESVFAVTDPELVGQIIACPKCGGMMLVETTEVAQDAAVAQDGENGLDAKDGENAQDDAAFLGVEASTLDETAQDKEVGEGASSKENGENGKVGEENDEPFERSRGGKFVAGGIALALVGALTFGGLRAFKNEPAPTSETSVEAENGENSEDATSGTEAEVGGFAPRAVEERTSEKEAEAEFEANESIALEDGEVARIDETGETGEVNEVGEDATVGDVAENAQDLSVATDGLSEDASLETGNSENSGNSEEGEDASTETAANVESAPPLDENVDDLGDLGGLGDLDALNEDESLGVEENETVDALESVDEETAAGEKLAGSNDATVFNEADFERANQNDDSENAEEPVEVDWSGVASTTSPTLQGALPTLRRERKEIDVDARLALPIKSIEFPTSPVAALRILSEFSGVSIVPDLETIVLTRASTGATLDLSLRDTTAGEALEKIAELLNWEVCRENDRILIRPNDYEPETLVEERFEVADLTTVRAEKNDGTRLEMFELPNNLTPEALAALLKSTVAPETWGENGGDANLTVDGTALAVSQSAQNREKTRILLETLRAIRGLETQGNAAPERIVPEKLAWEKLTKKTTFMPLAPVSLQNAIEILEKSQKFQVFWDDAALIEAGVGRDSTTAARVENGTLDGVLNEILEPLNAAYVLLGENLILVTSADVADDYWTVEFFSLVGENGARPTLDEARALVDEIKTMVAPESWEKSDASIRENVAFEESAEMAQLAGKSELETNAIKTTVDEKALNNHLDEEGQGTGVGEKKGAIWLDVESSCLIIRQSQPRQRELRRWLTARLTDSRNEKKEKTN